LKTLCRQSGATLVTALIFLVIMTLFAVSSINMSTVNFKIVANMQAQKQIDAAVQDAIEQTISTMNQFNMTPAGSTISTSMGIVAVSAPDCLDSKVATGYSAVVENIIPEDNTWELNATLADSITGAVSTIHQGVEIRMLAGNCP
jgi:Tfp pilus assembly protein PilX